jgi:hypothetical protein
MEIKVSQKKAQKAPQLGSVGNYALGCRLRLSGLSFSCNPAAGHWVDSRVIFFRGSKTQISN